MLVPTTLIEAMAAAAELLDRPAPAGPGLPVSVRDLAGDRGLLPFAGRTDGAGLACHQKIVKRHLALWAIERVGVGVSILWQ